MFKTPQEFNEAEVQLCLFLGTIAGAFGFLCEVLFLWR